MAELRIKELCKDRNMTQQDLADKLGIARSSLSQKLSNNPTLQSLEEIAKALDVDITELFVQENTTTKLTCPRCGQPIEIHIK